MLRMSEKHARRCMGSRPMSGAMRMAALPWLKKSGKPLLPRFGLTYGPAGTDGEPTGTVSKNACIR